ncbi:MAG: RNA polymerase sigma-70 factor [Actinomycetota bacterium]|nr:RNA polymerase sigma-70 factor [Actinomycetota bacterium]MDQ5808048.1 RNA polymerase sigma-70 factor [Actinomycetota bacterium]
MTTHDDLRGLAFAVAYRMLGSVAEAEDVVQEALLRLHRAEDVSNPEAFVTTVVTRLAIDVLRSARARRETYPGPWLPEPLVEEEAPRRVEDEETISLAFLVLLERLAPEERAVLVLREAFDYDFAQIAEIVGKSKANCRQILSRARKRIAEERPRFDADPHERRALAARFLEAARDGDMAGLVAMLAPDAVITGDGGGKARALPGPLTGAEPIARALLGFVTLGDRWGITLEPVTVNGQPGYRSVAQDGGVVNVVAFDVADGRVTRIHSILNPDKLAHLGAVSDVALRPSARRP